MEKFIDLLTEIEKYSDRYQFSFQFWGKGNNNVYIAKDDVDLRDEGGYNSPEEVVTAALKYIYRINQVPKSKQIV